MANADARRAGSEQRSGLNHVNTILEQWVETLGRRPDAEGRATGAGTLDEDRGQVGEHGHLGSALDCIEVRKRERIVRVPARPAVAVVRAESRVVYPGSIAVRGPLALPPSSWEALGVTPAVRAAFEFVASWFGAPFDAVNVCEPSPSWGLWHLRSVSLAQALASWKRAAPERFQDCLGRYGIDVVGVDRPTLVVQGARGSLLRGSLAEEIAIREPRLVALLAHAARDPAARTAQVEVAVRMHVQPALAVPVELRADKEPVSLSDALGTPRALSVALHAELTGGIRAVRELASLVGAEGPEAALQQHCAQLSRDRRFGELLQVSQILSSPELDAPGGGDAPVTS